MNIASTRVPTKTVHDGKHHVRYHPLCLNTTGFVVVHLCLHVVCGWNVENSLSGVLRSWLYLWARLLILVTLLWKPRLWQLVHLGHLQVSDGVRKSSQIKNDVQYLNFPEFWQFSFVEQSAGLKHLIIIVTKNAILVQYPYIVWFCYFCGQQ